MGSKVLYWDSVNGAATYNVRVLDDGTPFGVGEPVDITVTHISHPLEHEADLTTLSKAPAIYDIFVTAVDSAGNESAPLSIPDVTLDYRRKRVRVGGVPIILRTA